MCIEQVIVKNYRALRSTNIRLKGDINIIVGDNETGKSTLLEAINLALRCQLNRRPIQYELHPFLFNAGAVLEFIASITAGKPISPPEILIELYFENRKELAALSGTNNSLHVDQPGVLLHISLDEDFHAEYAEYIRNPTEVKTVPVEYYHVFWAAFSGQTMTARAMPVKSSFIDVSAISNTFAAHRYVLEIVRNYLTKEQQVDLALSYRKMKDVFMDDKSVTAINAELATKKGIVSDKLLSVSLDTTSRASWEAGVLPHLDSIPLPLTGKGEQNSIKIKLAIDASEGNNVLLMEEPENHQSHTNLNKLIGHVAKQSKGKQLLITTHSSFVLNKLGVEHILLFSGDKVITLNELTPGTKSYFMKLPGHDTLRMILAKQTILVEGPSDELIVQKAFFQKHGCMPLERGVEVISVGALAFKRFLEIAIRLNLSTCIVTDNDKNPEAVKKQYQEFAKMRCISICYSNDPKLDTLEPHLLHVNGIQLLNRVFGTEYGNDAELLTYMKNNKTECAMAIFDTAEKIEIPDYIQRAI